VLSLILRLEPLEPPEPLPETRTVVRLPDAAADTTSTDTATAAEPQGAADTGPGLASAAEITIALAAPLTDDPPSANGIGPAHQVPAARTAPAAAPAPPLSRSSSGSPLASWSAAVAAAHDACFILDVSGVVVSISGPAIDLLGSGPLPLIGRHILDLVNLVDLDTGAANPEYERRITPLSVLESPGLARSLIRVRHEGGAVVTLDTSSTPVHDCSGELLGSMTFISPIPTR
jgi:PAS domain-containing protein